MGMTADTASRAAERYARAAERIMEEHHTAYQTQMAEREHLVREMEQAFDVSNPASSPHKLNASSLYFGVLRTVQQLRMPDWSLAGSGRQSSTELQIVTQLLQNLMDRAGYRHVWTEQNLPMVQTGDAFMSVGMLEKRAEKGFPFTYRAESTARIYFPREATRLRNPGHDREARQVVIVREYDTDQAMDLFPGMIDHKEDAGPISIAGALTGTYGGDKQPDAANRQENGKETVQVAELIDLNAQERVLLFGPKMKVGRVQKGKDFPYRHWQTNEPYINLMHRQFFRLQTGMLGRGLLHAVYKLAIVERMLKNMGITYELQNLNPVKIVNVRGMTEHELKMKHKEARESQAALQEGVIFANAEQGADVKTMRTEPVIDELARVLQQIDRSFLDVGVNLQDLLTNPQKTAFAVEVEAVASTNLARYIQNQNSFAIEEAIGFAMNMVRQHVRDNDPTPLYVTQPVRVSSGRSVEVPGVTVQNEQGQSELVDLTLGDLAKNLREHEYRIVVHTNSGVVNPEYLKNMKRREALALASQLGKAQLVAEIGAEMLRDVGYNANPEQLLPQKPTGGRALQLPEQAQTLQQNPQALPEKLVRNA